VIRHTDTRQNSQMHLRSTTGVRPFDLIKIPPVLKSADRRGGSQVTGWGRSANQVRFL